MRHDEEKPAFGKYRFYGDAAGYGVYPGFPSGALSFAYLRSGKVWGYGFHAGAGGIFQPFHQLRIQYDGAARSGAGGGEGAAAALFYLFLVRSIAVGSGDGGFLRRVWSDFLFVSGEAGLAVIHGDIYVGAGNPGVSCMVFPGDAADAIYHSIESFRPACDHGAFISYGALAGGLLVGSFFAVYHAASGWGALLENHS